MEALARLSAALEQHYGPQQAQLQQAVQQGQQQLLPLPTLEHFTAQVRRLKRKTVKEVWCEMLVAQPGWVRQLAMALMMPWALVAMLWQTRS